MSTQDFLTTTSDEVHQRIAQAQHRFSEVVAAVDPAQEVAGGWTVAQVASHLVNVVNRYNDFEPGRLADDPRGVDVINERELAAYANTDIAEVLAELDREMDRFRVTWGPEQALPLDTPIPFHGGGKIDLQAALINLLGEYLVHGLDVASAAAQPWTIDERDGALLVSFASQILPAYVRAGNEARALVQMEVDGVPPWSLDVDGPRATARPPADGDQPDVVLGGSPSALALLFYGRLDGAEAERHGLEVRGGSSPAGAELIGALFEEP